MRGWLPVTVPGAPAAWTDLHKRFGKLPFADLFEPAIAYAERGYPVAPVTAHGRNGAARDLRRAEQPGVSPGWFAPSRRTASAPAPASASHLPDHARTLRAHRRERRRATSTAARSPRRSPTSPRATGG